MKRIFFYLALAAIFIFSGRVFRLSTPVSLEVQPTTIVWDVSDSKIEKVLNSGSFSKIRVTASQSFFAQGIKYFRIIYPSGLTTELPISGAYRFEAQSKALSGDWFVDKPAEELIADYDIELTPPFRVEAEFYGRSLQFTKIELIGEHSLLAQFRRGLINNDFFLDFDQKGVGSGVIEPPAISIVLASIEPFITGLGFASFLLALCLSLSLFSRVVPVRFRLPGLPSCVFFSLPFTLASLACAIFVASSVLESLPHFQDDLCYLLRAKWLSVGHLFQQKPPYFEFLALDHTYFADDKWLTIYPIGWPLILSIGELFGKPALVAPICAALGMLVLFNLSNRIHGKNIAILSCALALLSPLALVLSGSMLSHCATFMCLITSTFLLLKFSPRRMLFSGLLLGFSFGIRPLTALGFSFCFALFLISEFFLPSSRETNRLRLSHFFWFILGGSIGLIPLLFDNFTSTGNPLVFAYTIGKGHRLSINNLYPGILIGDISMALMQPMAFGWFWETFSGMYVAPFTYAFMFVVFLSGQAKRFDWLLLLIFLSTPLAYLFHDTPGMHGYGPRFYYESIFALFALSARGFAELFRVAGGIMADTTRRVSFPQLLVGLAICIIVLSPLPFLKSRIEQYKGYNSVDSRLAEQINQRGIDQGVVLLKSFYDFAKLANQFPADLSTSKLHFVYSTEEKTQLKKFFPDAKFYVVEGESINELDPPSN